MIFIPFGILIFLCYALIGAAFCITLVGAPIGKVYFRLLTVGMAPFGIEVDKKHEVIKEWEEWKNWWFESLSRFECQGLLKIENFTHIHMFLVMGFGWSLSNYSAKCVIEWRNRSDATSLLRGDLAQTSMSERCYSMSGVIRMTNILHKIPNRFYSTGRFCPLNSLLTP